MPPSSLLSFPNTLMDLSSKRAGTSSSRSLASTCSYPLQSSRKENAEDVWKEINLTSLHDYPITTTSITTDTSDAITKTRSFLGSKFLDFLSLNSASSCHYTGMPNTAGPLTSSCKRRANENAEEFHEKKFKRLMKNRESASRSRARKQAYTNELELELARQKMNGQKINCCCLNLWSFSSVHCSVIFPEETTTPVENNSLLAPRFVSVNRDVDSSIQHPVWPNFPRRSTMNKQGALAHLRLIIFNKIGMKALTTMKTHQ